MTAHRPLTPSLPPHPIDPGPAPPHNLCMTPHGCRDDNGRGISFVTWSEPTSEGIIGFWDGSVYAYRGVQKWWWLGVLATAKDPCCIFDATIRFNRSIPYRRIIAPTR